MTEQEVWKPILPYEGMFKGYEVSTLGNVRTLNHNGTGEVKLLTPSYCGNGVLQVELDDDGLKLNRYVHDLQYEAFIFGRFKNPPNIFSDYT